MDEDAWVTLRDASDQAGVSVSWLRKQYRRGTLPTREVAGPRGPQKLVPLDRVRALAAPFSPAAGAPGPASGTSPAAPRVPGLPQAVDRGSRAAVGAPDLALLDRLVEAEGRAARAEADAAHLRARLEAALDEIRRLRRLLAQAYDPPPPPST